MPRGIYQHKASQLFQKGHPDLVPKEARKIAGLKMKGHSVSIITRRKISLANKGKKYPYRPRPEIRKIMSGELNPSKRLEVRNKISEAKKGMKSPWTAERNRLNKGEKAPNWKGGLSISPYPFEFNLVLKERIRARDNYICQLCGITQQEQIKKSGRKLAVNHIDFNKNNCSKENLNTLCIACNTRINWNRKYWTNKFQGANL